MNSWVGAPDRSDETALRTRFSAKEPPVALAVAAPDYLAWLSSDGSLTAYIGGDQICAARDLVQLQFPHVAVHAHQRYIAVSELAGVSLYTPNRPGHRLWAGLADHWTWSGDGSILFIANGASVVALDPLARAPRPFVTTTLGRSVFASQIVALCAPNPCELVTAHRDGSLCRWSTQDAELVDRCQLTNELLSPQQTTLIVCGGDIFWHSQHTADARLGARPRAIGAAGDEVIYLGDKGVIRHSAPPHRILAVVPDAALLATSPDGLCMAVASSSGLIHCWSWQ